MKRTKEKEITDGYNCPRHIKSPEEVFADYEVQITPYYKVLPTLSPELRVLLLKAVLAQEASKKAETEKSTN